MHWLAESILPLKLSAVKSESRFNYTYHALDRFSALQL